MPISAGVETDLPPLATAADVAEFGTFSDKVVLAASESIRAQAEWHIAPRLTQTLTVDARGGTVLLLPTLLLASVGEVRDVTGDTPVVLTGWRKSPSGYLVRPCGWPEGPETIEVDVIHGYPSCPAELLPVLARRCADTTASTAGSLRLGSLQVGVTSVGTTITAQDDAIVRRYSL